MPGRHKEGVRGSVAKHGHTVGGKRSPEFNAWFNMLQRCNNPNHPSYKNYGGRGVSVSSDLHSFEAFLEEVGTKPTPSHSLERVDNELGYEKGNIKWETRKKQQRNRRANRKLTFRGETKTLVEWAEEQKIEAGTLRSRLRYGWPVEKALTTSLVKSGRPRKNHEPGENS